MIVFENVTKTLTRHGQKRQLLLSTNLKIPTDRHIALLTSSSKETSILIELMAGLTTPNTGRIVRTCRVSFPVGYIGGFDPDLPVRVNVAHVARLYGVNVKSTVDFVSQVSGIAQNFDKPFRHLPGPERRNLAHILAYSIPFDFYLHEDDVTRRRKRAKPGDKIAALFEARSRTAGMLIPVRSFKASQGICDMGIIMHGGNLLLFDELEQAHLESTRLGLFTK